MRDGIGIIGNIFHYALLLALVGSTFLIFIYLWRKGKLDMDEEAKYRMMEDEKQEDKNE